MSEQSRASAYNHTGGAQGLISKIYAMKLPREG
jgi:hypothetical protein